MHAYHVRALPSYVKQIEKDTNHFAGRFLNKHQASRLFVRGRKLSNTVFRGFLDPELAKREDERFERANFKAISVFFQ